ALECGHVLLQPRSEIAMRPARQQAGCRKPAQVPRRGARDKAIAVTDDVIVGREYFQERNALEHVRDTFQAGADLRRLQVMQHVGAYDQVEATWQAQLGQLAETGQANAAAAP